MLCAQIHANTQLLAENSSRQTELKLKEDEITSLRAEAARVVKVREATIKKMKGLEDTKTIIEQERETLKVS